MMMEQRNDDGTKKDVEEKKRGERRTEAVDSLRNKVRYNRVYKCSTMKTYLILQLSNVTSLDELLD